MAVRERFLVDDSQVELLYYLMKPRGTRELHSRSYTRGVRESMHWLPIAELDRYTAYPSFMKEYLLGDREGIKHIVSDERGWKSKE